MWRDDGEELDELGDRPEARDGPISASLRPSRRASSSAWGPEGRRAARALSGKPLVAEMQAKKGRGGGGGCCAERGGAAAARSRL